MAEENEDEVLDQNLDAPINEQPSIDGEAQESEEIVVTLGEPKVQEDEEPLEDRPSNLVTKLRDLNRKKDKILREREKELAELRAKSSVQVDLTLGPKPTWESSGYDPEKFQEDTLAWNEKKRQVDAMSEKQAAQKRKQDEDWLKTREGYETAKSSLNIPDFDVAEESVKNTFSEIQQSLILGAAEKSAELIYALGSNPDKAIELAKIEDPVKFVAAVARLEARELKVTKKSVTPERQVAVSGTPSGVNQRGYEKRLAELEAEAERTGNRSKIIAFKRDYKARQAQR